MVIILCILNWGKIRTCSQFMCLCLSPLFGQKQLFRLNETNEYKKYEKKQIK